MFFANLGCHNYQISFANKAKITSHIYEKISKAYKIKIICFKNSNYFQLSVIRMHIVADLE